MRIFDLFCFKYNRTDFHELNLDWIISDLRTLAETLENFINLNTIKYANPIQWNITTQYEANTVVIDANDGTAYLSVKPVPSGVAITNTDYWTPIFTLDMISANKNLTLRDDGSNVLATFASAADDWLVWNGTLYKVSRAINVNEAYVAGYNLKRYTVELFIKDMADSIKTIIGDLDDLKTQDKTNLVAAINEIATQVLGKIGDLSNLTTEDKSNLVTAINEIITKINNVRYYVTPEEFGAKGDGVTDDTEAFRQAFLTDKPVICMPNKEYIVGVIDLSSLSRLKLLDGNHSIIRGATLHINCAPGSQTPVEPWVENTHIRNVIFIANGSEDCLHIGGGLKMENCRFDEYDTFCRFTDNYIDDLIFNQVVIRNYSRGDRDAFRVYHVGLCDLAQLRGVKCSGRPQYMAKHTFGFSYVTGKAEHCINVGFSFNATSDFTIANSFFGIGYQAEFTVAQSASSLITVDSCVFAGVRYIFDRCKYQNCWFKETAASGGIASKGLTIEKFKQLENCNISIGNTDSTLSTYNIIHSKYNDSDFNYSISSNQGILSVGVNVLDTDNEVEGVPLTGNYTYHVVPSMFPDKLVRYKSNILSGSHTVTANAGKAITIVYNDDFKNAYKHIYRENPDNTIDYAVIPPTDPTLTGLRAGTLIDNGTLCGFKWNRIASLPTLGTSSVTMKNNIVSGTDANLPSGTLYIDTDSTIKQA